MNYCEKRGRRWVCTANSLRKQQECDYFTESPDQLWCACTDTVARCNNLIARANSRDNPEPLDED